MAELEPDRKHLQAVKRIEASGVVGPCHGNLAKVRAIIEAKPQLIGDMNAVNASAVDETPQGAAAHTRSKEIVSYLHQRGVRLNVFMAAAMGKVDEVVAFLQDDPSLAGASGAHGIPLISHAADRATADAMLRNGVDCDIFTAVGLDLAEYVAGLLRSDPSLANVHTKQGVSLVQTACVLGREDIVKVLLAAGADDPEDAGKHFLVGGDVSGRQ